MTKTLSEQLCEICEIVPLRMYTHTEEGKTQTYLKYPDFTKPENFVKLLEIVHKYLYFITPRTEESFVNGCLEYLLKGLDSYAGFNRFYRDKEIREAIRKADWNWE